MRNTRRQTARGGTITSSSEENDQDRTLKVINSLSQKYLKPVKRKSPRLSKVLCEQGDNVYDGDVDTNTDSAKTASSCDSSPQVYDFEDNDEEQDQVRLKLVLSPDRKTNRKTTARANPAKASRVEPRGRGSKRTLVQASTENKNKRQSTRKADSDSQAKKMKQTGEKKQQQPVISSEEPSSLKRSSRRGRKADVSCGDSGVFMTPSSVLGHSSVTSTPSAAPTSTPTLTMAKPSSQPDTPCFGFDSLRSPPPFLSPVQRVTSPSSEVRGQLVTSQDDLSLPIDEELQPSPTKLKTLDISRTYANMPTSVRKSLGGKKKARTEGKGSKTKKPKLSAKHARSISKAEEYADRMNQEFEDIENFTLSIDDE